MGMDVHGINPKQNKSIENYPLLKQVKELERQEAWKQRSRLLDDVGMDVYWAERDEYEGKNKGIYFRNNCWWWRPLWNYCRVVAPDLIDRDLFDSGHNNSGAGLDDKGAKELGKRLLAEINNSNTIQYQASYQQYLDDLPDDDCMRCNNNNHGHNKKRECTNCKKTGKSTNFNKSYPFDIDNVREFAEFCLQSGGFEIC